MKYGGLFSLPLGLVIGWAWLSSRFELNADNKAANAALLTSIILFATGGVIGFLIHGVNVVIPAHYHGSIVGVTLAFMGIAYYLLPQLGYRPANSKMAHIQPYVYAGGQLMHVLGLAWSGGYGVQRKTAGSAQGLDSLPEVIGMGMMGLGGLISIIGGILFLIVMLRSMWPEKS
ncbi:MAG: cbb3-type cytochrome c oxidase subunit I, partial [Gammaproteobacteria bacterium]|nr:cbb3-type cytochrome c oxidase subunit I [Gammaproteobacteria bacterium]